MILCTHPTCLRRGVRTVKGNRFCLFHPDDTPPDLDHEGKPRDPKKVEKARRRAQDMR